MFHIIQAQRSIRASCSTQCQCQCHWPLSATRWFFHRIYHRLPHSLRTERDVPVFCSKPLAYYHWSSKVWRQACSAGARTNYIVIRYTILENNLGYWHKALLLKKNTNTSFLSDVSNDSKGFPWSPWFHRQES